VKLPPIVCIGLDSCDPGVARGFAATGAMPNLARLLGESSSCRVASPFGLLVGAVWLSFTTAVNTARHRFHCWDHIEPHSYERGFTELSFSQPSFWKRLSDAGCRVAAIDVPHRRCIDRLKGLEVSEWGCHDRHFGFQASPSTLADEIEATYGYHPVFGPDPQRPGHFAPDDWVHRKGKYRTIEEEKALFRDLCAGAKTKKRMTLDLLGREEWDLFLSVFGESHAIGHQQWHLHDPVHPRFDPDMAAALGCDPVERLYGLLDDAVGAVAARVPAEALFLVFLSHGMGPHYDATHMLDEILTRLDRLENGRHASTIFADRAKRAVWPLVAPLGRMARAIAVPAAARAVLARAVAAQEHATPKARARQLFFSEPNNSVYGGIRFNLAGRESKGRVRPDEVEILSARLTEDLLAIRDEKTGEPIVRSVIPCELHHERRPDDVMPDLLVEWSRHGQVATVTSPKIGIVHAPYQGWRTGDHRPDGLLLARGPGLPPGTNLPAIKVEDIGPTIAARLGVTLEGMDGRVVEWLARSADARELI
jgi:predicted AlkP superfamily phosphohydrolase/phosphomutase